MAWKYPKRPIKGTYVADIDAVNQNFLTIAEESAGYLNEHNFRGTGLDSDQEPSPVRTAQQQIATRAAVIGAGSLVVDRTRLPEDVAYRLHYTEPKQARVLFDFDQTNWTQYTASDFYVSKAISGFSMTRTFSGGVVWICCSFTLHAGRGGGAGQYPAKKGFGFNVALEVDGAIIPESIVGTGDITEENFMDEYNVGNALTTLTPTPKGGGGINGARNAIVVDAVTYLPAGRHSIRLAIQDIRGSNASIDNAKVYVSTIELFALELMG